ncbi:MarR family winged helix-turn-helix transcriptional regulator [Nocardiopsis kunsanensis]|uniref:MarR family winged helix-turn-helix transcriptional regulator n=1 Tax=Nocardiopsis kunsanensis TaxID=141693 RepID=UPI00037FC8DC|nr:MarR family transcriptional regulator [Nocardiopsis kunsanensis]
MTPTTPDSPRKNDLGWSLAVLLRHWHERVEVRLSDVRHGSRGYHVLTAVAEHEAPTQASLAERLLIDRSVMTYLLDDLEEDGIVRREVDVRDRRVRRVCVTDRGRQLLEEIRARVAEEEQHLLAGVDLPTQNLFRDAAARAALAVQQRSPGTDPCAAVHEVAPEAAEPRESGGPAAGER